MCVRDCLWVRVCVGVCVCVNAYDREMERLVASMNMSGRVRASLCKIMDHAGVYCHHESLIISDDN